MKYEPLTAEEMLKLRKFYQVETLMELIAAQDHHIEQLQAQLPPIKDAQPRPVRA